MPTMQDFTPLIYSQPVRTGAELYFPTAGFQAEYKGFKYRKEEEHSLYFIVCPEGRVLPYDLSGRFSRIRFLEEAIDKWLSANPSGELPLVPEPIIKRSHHKKKEEGVTLLDEDN
jgi:hypothetical protein